MAAGSVWMNNNNKQPDENLKTHDVRQSEGKNEGVREIETEREKPVACECVPLVALSGLVMFVCD